MTTAQTWQTIFEVLLAVSTIVAVFNEDKFCNLEQKLKARWKK